MKEKVVIFGIISNQAIFIGQRNEDTGDIRQVFSVFSKPSKREGEASYVIVNPITPLCTGPIKCVPSRAVAFFTEEVRKEILAAYIKVSSSIPIFSSVDAKRRGVNIQ